MAEHDITLVTAKAASVVIEGMKASLATPAGGLTPATITAMVGIAKGEALKLAKPVTDAMAVLQHHATLTPNSAGYIPGVSGAGAASALSNLETLQSKLLPPGNHAAFGQILSQAQGHITDSKEIKAVTDFISSTEFTDYGSGISKMTDLATQGIDNVVGKVSAAGDAILAAGPLFDLKDISTFGTAAGLYNKLASVKLANVSGLNKALTDAGVDINNINDPIHAIKVDKVLRSITDPKVISTISEQVSLSAAGTISSLKDFTDINKLAPSAVAAELKDGITGIATKFNELSASFPSVADAGKILKNIEVAAAPILNETAKNLSSYMNSVATDVKTQLVGIGEGLSTLSGPGGLPSMSDFTHAVSGGPELSAISANAGLTTAHLTALSDSITKTTNLLNKAGIDTSSLPIASLGTAMTFATSLHKFGADISETGVGPVLAGMANTASHYGESIKLALIEGKNKATLALAGIRPLQYSIEADSSKALPTTLIDNPLS